MMIVDAPDVKTQQVAQSPSIGLMEKSPCSGICVLFLLGQNEHIAYPFGLHNKLSLSWNYHSINNQFFLQSESCSRSLVYTGNVCVECEGIWSNVIYQGIAE